MSARSWYRRARQNLLRATRRPRIGHIEFGDLGRLAPVSRDWGFDRGTPVDRIYIERFVASHADDIRGRVLEVANNDYSQRYGGTRVTRSDILHPVEGNPRATIVADLARPAAELDGQFDCIICTQTLQLIYDVGSAVTQLHRWLRPGGVALVTVPGISQISREDMRETGDFWRFTEASVRRLFAGAFGSENVAIEVCGNVLAAITLLHGIAAEEIDPSALLETDPQFQVIIAVRAVRPA